MVDDWDVVPDGPDAGLPVPPTREQLDQQRREVEAAAEAANSKQGAELKRNEMCDHMIQLIDYCRLIGVEFGGCGCDGSPWLDCAVCGAHVDSASAVFDSWRGGQPVTKPDVDARVS